MAAHQARKDESRLDTDLIVSLVKRNAATEAADLAATPEADKQNRCWMGDTPYFAQLSGGHFSMLMMTDHQLRLWAFCCQSRLNGLYIDATEGSVGHAEETLYTSPPSSTFLHVRAPP